jgi:hypothetical protein
LPNSGRSQLTPNGLTLGQQRGVAKLQKEHGKVTDRDAALGSWLLAIGSFD